MVSIEFLSVELVENILVFLPMHDLYLVRRVCKIWGDIIAESPQLQRRMFLPNRCHSRQLSLVVHNNIDSATESRTSSKNQALGTFVEEKSGTTSIHIREPKSRNHIVHFNPVFPSERGLMRTRTKQFREPPESCSSWLEMYLTQPPCDYAEMSIYFKPRSPKSFIGWLEKRKSDTAQCIAKVRRPQGVRARDVFEEARKLNIGDVRKWQRIDIWFPGTVRA